MVAHGGSSVLFLSLAARNRSGALSCAKLSTMGKKIWSSMHPRNFGSEKSSVRGTSVRTSTPSCKPG